MSATNLRVKGKSHLHREERLAGGFGKLAARQGAEQDLRRSVMACLLWEDIAYQDGQSVVDQIKILIPQVDAQIVSDMAVEARYQQKLRHVPLLMVSEMVRHNTHRPLVAKTLAKICKRPDEMGEFLSLYWGKKSDRKAAFAVAAQVKKGLALAFQRYDAYQLAKYDQDKLAIKLKDILFLCHAKPKDDAQAALWKQLIDGTLPPADTWEVGLSAAKSEADKRDVWVRLVENEKLPAFAFLSNLRNMQQVGVPRATMLKAFEQCRTEMLLPINFLKARHYAPDWTREIEALMLKCAAQWPKLGGWTTLVVDVSGSMATKLSDRSEFNRMDAAAAMAVLASECCEHISVWATAGNDHMSQHKTMKVQPLRGFALADAVLSKYHELGGGGIFTRQLCEHLRTHEKESPDRLVVFSDSQDCDHRDKRPPQPHGSRNYIVDVSSHNHGVNYKGVWTAEVAGWSEHFLRFIAELESSNNQVA